MLESRLWAVPSQEIACIYQLKPELQQLFTELEKRL
jgi:hypothetical protein